MRPVQLDTDCEGPLALNDNAFELCRDFLQPEGDRFFKQVSRYDDFLADIAKKPGYKAGETLKLILPFLKAAGLTNARIQEYCAKTVRLVPGAAAAYGFLHTQNFPIFAISTSYRQFAEAVGHRLGFGAAQIYATDLDLDRYQLSPPEAAALSRLKAEIVAAPELELPPEARALEDLPGAAQETIHLLERIFWEQIPALDIGLIYQEVNPIGGFEKAQALKESLARTGLKMADAIYVGDSITDVQAFKAIRAGGGLGISFNGNRYAVKASEVIVVADTVWPVALLACIFRLWGKEGVLEVAGPESPSKSRYLVLPQEVIQPLSRGLEGHNFSLYRSDNPKLEQITQESAAMRAKLRGAAVAALG